MIEIKFSGSSMSDLMDGVRDFLAMQDRPISANYEDPDNSEKQRETSVEEEPTVEGSKTQEDVTALVKAKIDEGKSKEIKALLKKYNAAKVTALEEEHFDAFYEDLEEL